MGLSLRPQHLSRYRQVARLLFKYGRDDLIREAGLDDPSIEASEGGSRLTSAKSKNEPAAVHDAPGDILREQRKLDEVRARSRAAGRSRELGLEGGSAAAAERAAADHEATNGEPRDLSSQLPDDLEALGPTYIKLGQFLSTRGDLLPTAYLEELARLQDQVKPFPFADVERIIMEDLGVRISKAFAAFDDTPIAAASLGQVHRAELRDGCLVAVKVQRPDIHDQILKDLEALDDIAEMLDRRTKMGKRHDFTGMMVEFRRALLQELDYRQEARNLMTLAENLSGFERILVPFPVEDYVSARVLTMDFVKGRKVTELGPLTRLEHDLAPLADDLCRVYLQQILVDGFFHADPHPGNVFLTDDQRLAFIDLGMTARISPTLQEDLLKLVLAISEGRGEDTADVLVKIGTPIGEPDIPAVRREIAAMVSQFQGLRIRDIALGRLLFDVSRRAADGGIRMPRELTMICKALLNLDEVARQLDQDFDPNAAIRRNASEIMRRRMMKALSPGRLFEGMLDLKEFVEKLPRRVNGLIDAAAENRLKLRVDAIDEVLLMEGLQKIANRITMGLVISALVIGAALLMRIDSTFRILGYPGIAILFFLIAAIGAVLMIFNIVASDLRAAKHKLREVARQKEERPWSGPS